ncbi:LuxR C-terminal-related transcriptional regulator [Streptomyces sp. NPDC051684]|uniref:helix-turn-helix transcriptional regulator n=1 Tax=Streptomyces sp. NPDC051684 TaxID=3365670 RepID=UPI0037980C9F
MNPSPTRRTPGELPAETTSFVGRRRELVQIADVLTRARLVTLTGPGGVGKSRTAVRAARDLRGRYPDGVRLVELSALRDPALLANAVAAALDLPEQAARPAIEVIADHLEDRELLLLLDTCEHLVDACAVLCDELLRCAPRLRIVATSRQPLDVPGEHVLAIGPLSMPEPAAGAERECECDALALFADRASAAVPGFTVSGDNRSDVLALCRRLDGIPLAIELAVSRLRVLSLDEMLARLDDRFRLLTGGRRTSVPRHQTLRTAIGWSHDLSTAAERLLWARRRHLEYFLDAARAFDQEWTGDAQIPLLRALVRDQANVRVALEYCLATPRLHCDGLEMATALWGYWHATGLLTEGRYWLRRTLDGCRDETPHRVKALYLISWYMDIQGERGKNEALLKEAEQVAARIGDRLGAAWTLAFQAHRRYFLGQMEGCADDFDEARARMTTLGDETGLLMLGFYAGFMLIITGDHDKGIAWCEDSLARGAAHPGEQWARSWALWVKSVGLWLKGDPEGSVECAREGIRSKAALHDLMGLAHFMEGLAWHAARLRRFERVAALQGAADALWRRAAKEARFGLPVLHGLHDHAADLAREVLGADGYHNSFEEGAALPFDFVLDLALDDESAPSPDVPPQRSGPTDGLTPRERQVAALVGEGRTNREIAAKLVVSKRTIDSHVEHILTKLGFTSRSQIAALHVPPSADSPVPPSGV